MITYTFFELNDLEKFFKICSYDFKAILIKLSSFLRESYTNISVKQNLTEHINKMDSTYLTELNQDLISNIKSKEETIEQLRHEIFLLENIKERIKDCSAFNKAFEIIVKIVK